MISTSEGLVWKFGDDVNTDLIIPGRHLNRYDPGHLAAHAMEGVSKEYASKVKPGDIIIAGDNFGCGSSREQAVTAIKASGASAVVARSFARIFYRNSVNLGLMVIVSREAHDIFEDGDTVTIDWESHTLVSKDSYKKAQLEKVPEHVERIIQSGGLVPYLRARLETDSEPRN